MSRPYLLLNAGCSAFQARHSLAILRGYGAEAQVERAPTPGTSAWNAVSASIVAVHNASPRATGLLADGPINDAADLPVDGRPAMPATAPRIEAGLVLVAERLGSGTTLAVETEPAAALPPGAMHAARLFTGQFLEAAT